MGQGASSATVDQAAVPLTLDQMRRAIEADDLPADVAAVVLADFKTFVRGQGRVKFDAAFGFDGSGNNPWPSIRSWWCKKALRAADAALCPPGTSVVERSDKLRLEIRRYGSTTWARDQRRAVAGVLAPIESLPTADDVWHRATSMEINRLLFVAFQAVGGDVAESPEHLRKILADPSY